MKIKQIKQEILEKVLVPGNRVFEECVAFNPIIDGLGNTRDDIYFPRSIYGSPKVNNERREVNIISKREVGSNSLINNSLTCSSYMKMVLDDLAVLSAADNTGVGIFDFIPEYIVPLDKQRWIECCDKCDVRDPEERRKSFISLDLYSTTLKMYIEVDGRCHDMLECSKSDQARKMYMEEEHSISELRLKYYASGKQLNRRDEVVSKEKRDAAREDLRRILTRRWEIGKDYLDRVPNPHRDYGHYMLDSFVLNALEYGSSALKGYEFYTESPKRTVNQAVNMVVEYLGKKWMPEKCRKRLAQEIRFINRLIKGKNR